MRSGFRRLLVDLGRNRIGVDVDLTQDVRDEIVLEGRPEQVLAVEVEASPLERRLRGPLKELARRVAEELGDVDLLDSARAASARRSPPPSPPGELGEPRSKKSEKKSSKRPRPPSPWLLPSNLGQADFAQLLGLGADPRAHTSDRRHGRAESTSLAELGGLDHPPFR